MAFLRWAGSKSKLCDVLQHCWHASQVHGTGRYIEGFAGSASLFFTVKPASAILIDINSHLIDCLRGVRDYPAAVARHLAGYGVGADTYYKIRAEKNSGGSLASRAARFIYLNRFCFNGLYRTNSSGAFNVPYGGGKTGSLPTIEALKEASMVLKLATLQQGDFNSRIEATVKKADFVYLDPPYAMRNHSLDLQYGPDVFGASDLDRLAKLLDLIDQRGASFVVSYGACDDIANIGRRWTTHRVKVQRTIAADTSRRGIAEEVLISNL